MLQTRGSRWLIVSAIAGVLFVSRWPLLSPWLTSFDAANFAFALDEFNPSEHKPQPPGYPLYVGLSRVLRLAFSDPADVFFAAGLIAALLAVVFTMWLARDMFGAAAGWCAAALLTFHPAMWSAGLVNPVRVFLAAGTAAVAWLAWRARVPGSHPAWLWSSAAALGVACGFRPALIFLCLPLIAYAAWHRKTSAAGWFVTAAIAVLGASIWTAVSAHASGGFSNYLALLATYAEEQFEVSSLLYGAPLLPAVKMAVRALVWAYAPALVCAAALPLIPRSKLLEARRGTGSFLATWTVPPLLLYTLIHSAEPGHILPLVVPACVVASFFAARAAERWASRKALAAVAGALVLWNCLLFLRPVLKAQTLSSAVGVRDAHQTVDGTLRLAATLDREAPVAVIATPASAVAWRIVSFYHPNVLIAVLRSEPGIAAQPSHYLVRGGEAVGAGAASVELPPVSTLLWLRPKNSIASLAADPPVPQRAAGTSVIARPRPGTVILMPPYSIRVGEQPLLSQTVP